MSENVPDLVPEGYYRDHHGNLHKDRRQTVENRRVSRSEDTADGDRRNQLRRQCDRENLDREHHSMIEDALEDFAANH